MLLVLAVVSYLGHSKKILIDWLIHSFRKRLHFTAFYALLNRPISVTVNKVTTETGSLGQWFAFVIKKIPAKNWGSYSSGLIGKGLVTQVAHVIVYPMSKALRGTAPPEVSSTFHRIWTNPKTSPWESGGRIPHSCGYALQHTPYFLTFSSSE